MPRKTYDIEITASAARSLRKLERPAQVRIGHVIDSLATQARPSGAIKLSGGDELYRVRIGNYRIIYSIVDNVLTVLVVAIGHRRDIYRR